MAYRYRSKCGNRLPVPREVPGKHFLYATHAPELDPKDVALLVKEIRHRWQLRGLTGPHIDAMSPSSFAGMAHVKAACDRVTAATRAACQGEDNASVDFLVCQWAAPHVDPDYEGIAFYSTVLHTGPHAYLMQTLHTERTRATEDLPDIFTSEQVLKVGTAFVFDPTTPHFAAPGVPHEEQLLILLQTEVKDNDARERAALLKALPPIEPDSSSPSWAKHWF